MTDSNKQEDQIFDLIYRLNLQLSPKFERCTGISPSRLSILHQLFEVDEISQTNLQKEVNIDSAAITRHLKQLEASGMVQRRNDPTDNRFTLVRLTDQGRNEIAAYKKEKQQFVAQLLQDFNEQERSDFHDMLRRMLNNLQHY